MGQLKKTLNKEIQATTIETAKYLGLTLSQEVYWIDYLKRKEILDMMDIKSTPQTHEFVKGVIDPQGKVIQFNDNVKAF